MSTACIEILPHRALLGEGTGELRGLFDVEYLADFGVWNPEQPYGYAPHDVHVIARICGDLAGHVGWARRRIAVGERTVEIAGVGGVLVAECARGMRVGEQLMSSTRRSMLDAGGVQFGFLGCREGVVPFYASCGWHRISAAERSVSRIGSETEDPPGHPPLIMRMGSGIEEWPAGMIDLRGRAW